MSIVFLDVDGVLIAVTGARQPPPGWPDFTHHPEVNGYPLWLSRQMMARLLRLDAEIVWCTTWEHDAPRHIAPLVGAPDLRVLDLSPRWKPAAIAEELRRRPQPWVWIDDDAIAFGPTNDILHLGLPGHVTRPDLASGLTPAELDGIEAFLALDHVRRWSANGRPG